MAIPVLPITNEIDDLIREIERLKQTINNLQGMSDSDRDILRDAERRLREKTNRLKELVKRRRGMRWRLGLRGAGYAALAYLLIAAIYDRSVELTPHPDGGKGVCAITVPGRTIKVEESAVGPKSSYNDALATLNATCASTGLSCADEICPTCGADVLIQSVDVKTRIFWYTTEIIAICRCWCK